jgi:glyoxylase I family protein
MVPCCARRSTTSRSLSPTSPSIRGYEAVFRIRFLKDIPHKGGVGSLLADEARTLVIVLHRHDANDGRPFRETLAGLDHVGLRVLHREDLVAWQAHLEAHGVERRAAADAPLTQSPIADEPYASVLVFRDPDNIQLELSSPPSS